jgi:hypothetical protein
MKTKKILSIIIICIIFFSSLTAQIEVLTNGNVTIGTTTSPQTKLHVV